MPTEDERVVERILYDEVISVLSEFEVDPILVGSLAKDTDLKNNKDVDIFIRFKEDVDRKTLEREGLKIGKYVFTKLGGKYEIDYAEHPYVKGILRDYTVEIVPCYSGGNRLSAVDRTPYHTEYVLKKTRGNNLNNQIRLLKQFMKGIGVYGAEAKVEGFSGYLVEILTIHYGGFQNVLEAAVKWRYPAILDTETLWKDSKSLGKIFNPSQIIVVDPVDKGRNVAAAVSPESLLRFQLMAKKYIEKPDLEYFFPKPVEALSNGELEGIISGRKTFFAVLSFQHEKKNVNTIYAQLRKTMKHIVKALESMEFIIFRSGFWTNEKDSSVILLEFELWKLPKLIHHIGPPLKLDIENQKRFLDKYMGDKPYQKDGRWVVDTERQIRDAESALDEIISSKGGFGKNFREFENAKVFYQKDIVKIEEKGWHQYLTDYLS